jgi:DNA-binding response OmpR family regulator
MAVNRPILQNIKIVVVDDHADICLLIARFLSSHGAEVFAAKNASDGLRVIREMQPDLATVGPEYASPQWI